MFRFILLGVLTVAMLGCDQPANTSPSSAPAAPTVAVPPPPPGSTAATPPAAMPDQLPPGTIRAEDAKGVWTRAQVEEHLKKNIPLTEVSLTETTPNNYTGTGKNAEGANFQLTVGQVPGGIACKFTHDRGGSGGLSFGNPVPGF
jgi:hypothetical protein